MAQSTISDSEILEAALLGLERRCSEIDEGMAELRRKLGIRRSRRQAEVSLSSAGGAQEPKRPKFSAAARRRMAASQRKRWATLKKMQAAKVVPVKKRQISAAGMKRIIAATKKRWAEFHAKNAAARKKKLA